jgi:hypothetical protein
MHEFSIEFWIGAAIAAFTLVLGLGVTLAMDAKTRGEFRFAAGCFLLAAASTVYVIGVFEMSVMWPASLRVPAAWMLFATVAVLACEGVRWAHGRHLRAVAVLSKEKPSSPQPPPSTEDKKEPPPKKPRPSKPVEKTQPTQKIIQTGPVFGNIKERALALADEIMVDLYRHGWREDDPGHPPPTMIVEHMPSSPDDIRKWTKRRSDHFLIRYLEKVLFIRNELFQLHFQDELLDDLLKFQATKEKQKKQFAAMGLQKQSEEFDVPIQPVEIEIVVERLRVLANKVP